jgi:hypothetical protein
LHANSILQDDIKDWKVAILALMEANPAMPRLVLAMLTGTLPAGDDTDEDEDVVEFDSNGCMRLLFYCDVVGACLATCFMYFCQDDSNLL